MTAIGTLGVSQGPKVMALQEKTQGLQVQLRQLAVSALQSDEDDKISLSELETNQAQSLFRPKTSAEAMEASSIGAETRETSGVSPVKTGSRLSQMCATIANSVRSIFRSLSNFFTGLFNFSAKEQVYTASRKNSEVSEGSLTPLRERVDSDASVGSALDESGEPLEVSNLKDDYSTLKTQLHRRGLRFARVNANINLQSSGVPGLAP